MEDQFFNSLVNIRRHLHQNPELGFKEFKTSALVESHLRELDIPFERVAVTGLIGTIQKGPGPLIVLRADMDALPVHEDTGLPFSSLDPHVMHACGHDIHTTMLLGAARLLKEAEFQGTVKLLFQPSEEGNTGSPEKGKTGAQLIVETGKLNDASAIIGLHVHPLLPVGKLTYKNGEALANVGNFTIRIHGQGGHPGAMEHVIDPILIAGHLITRARNMVSEEYDPTSAALAFTHVESLARPSFNVIPSAMLLQGTLRTISIRVYRQLEERIQNLIKELEITFRCRIDLEYSLYVPSLLNDAAIHEKLGPVLEKIFGQANVQASQARLIGEDFAFYSRAIPAQFYFLGAKTEENDSYYLHHPKVTFNEGCIKYGTPFLVSGAIQLLHGLAGSTHGTASASA